MALGLLNEYNSWSIVVWNQIRLQKKSWSMTTGLDDGLEETCGRCISGGAAVSQQDAFVQAVVLSPCQAVLWRVDQYQGVRKSGGEEKMLKFQSL